MHHPSAPPGAQAPHDKDYLRRLLAERNQVPANAAGIDAAIEQAFVRNVAILVLDMCGFSRITQSHGIIHFLAMIHQMEQAARPAIRGNGGEIIKQEADNLFAVFNSPGQALEAALRAHFSFARRQFGQTVSVDEVSAVAQAVAGVQAVHVTRLHRVGQAPGLLPRLFAALPVASLTGQPLPAELLTLADEPVELEVMP